MTNADLIYIYIFKVLINVEFVDIILGSEFLPSFVAKRVYFNFDAFCYQQLNPITILTSKNKLLFVAIFILKPIRNH